MSQYGAKHISNKKRIGYRHKSSEIIKRRRRKGRKQLIA